MKMNPLFSLLIVALLGLVSCKNASAPVTEAETEANPNSFGAGVKNADNPIAFADLLTQLESQDTVQAVLKAKVSEVCQMKGCWMNLVDSQSAANEDLFVKFKDYAFFVPMDIAGREVLIEGIAYKEETSVEELRHYAEDENKSAEEIAAITEPEVQTKFMATGVVLLDQ
jgi:hypothetical protein